MAVDRDRRRAYTQFVADVCFGTRDAERNVCSLLSIGTGYLFRADDHFAHPFPPYPLAGDEC